jgi:oxygen-dependent protoporphyrinogen oxidase
VPAAAVAGAGLAGLTAAHRLCTAGWDVTVFEASDGVGGRVQTVARDGYLIDTGATALATTYTDYLDLVAELGLAVRPAAPIVGVYRDGRVHELRMDRMLRTGARTRLLSRRAKLRAGRLAADVARARLRGQLDYADMRRAAPLDTESAATYAERALGGELAAYLCEPVVRTMLIADAEIASKVELFSGLANIFTARIQALAGGQGRLPCALAEGLDVRLSHRVTRLEERGDGVDVGYEDAAGVAHEQRFDAGVAAVPLPVAVQICPGQQGLLGPIDGALGYTSSITVAVGTRRPPQTPAFLVQLSSREDADVALLFLDHNKAADRAPPGHGLIGCCWEARAAARMLAAPDEAIVARTLQTVERVFPEVGGAIDFTHVTRWPRALPHTRIGAYRAIGEFNARLDDEARIQFAADYMSAAGQHTAVAFGTRAAANLIRAFAVA